MINTDFDKCNQGVNLNLRGTNLYVAKNDHVIEDFGVIGGHHFNTTISHLNSLNLSKCNLTQESVDLVMGSLAQFRVKFLSLADNDLKDEGVCHVINLLKGTSNIHTLDLSNNLISDKQTQWVDTLLYHTGISWVLLKNNLLTSELGQSICDKLTHITYMGQDSKDKDIKYEGDRPNYRKVKVVLDQNPMHLHIINQVKNMHKNLSKNESQGKLDPKMAKSKITKLHTRAKSMFKQRSEMQNEILSLEYESKKVKNAYQKGEIRAESVRTTQQEQNQKGILYIR